MNSESRRRVVGSGLAGVALLLWCCSLDTSGTALFPASATGTAAGSGTGTGTATSTGSGSSTGTGAGTSAGTGTGAGTNGGTGTGTGSGGQGGAGGAGGDAGQGGGAGGITDPTDLAGLELWLRADAGITSNMGAVSFWADQSGRNNDAVSVISAEQPQLRNAAFNGHPAVDFDGVDDRMAIAAAAGFDPGTGSYFCMAAGRWLGGQGAFKLWFGKSSDLDAANWRLFRTNGSRLLVLWGADDELYPPSSAAVPDGMDAVMGWGVDAVTGEVLYVVGPAIERIGVTISGVGANSLPATIAGEVVANGYTAHVRLGEQVFYSRPSEGFSNVELANLRDYFRSKYGI